MAYALMAAETPGTSVPASSVEYWRAIHRLRLTMQGVESWNLAQLDADAQLYLKALAANPPTAATPAEAAENAKLTAYARHVIEQATRARSEGRSLTGPPKWLVFVAVLAAIPLAWLVLRKGTGEWRHTTTVRREWP